MTQHTLSKAQARAVVTLVQQRNQLQQEMNEVGDAIAEQLEMLRRMGTLR